MTSPQPALRGSQVPRVANFPAYDLSAAPEIIDLAARAGLVLDEWQQYVLTHGLGMTAEGEWSASRVSVWVPRQNGKGAIIEALELAWLFLLDEDLVVHSSHQHRTSQKAYQRLEKLIRNTPAMHKRVKAYRVSNGEQEIRLHDGRMLQYTTRSGTAVRGFSAPKIVLDEAQELNDEQIAAMMPTVSAMDKWQVWFFGTPPRLNDAWAYGLKDDGEAGDVSDLAHFDWGMPGNPDDPKVQTKIHDPVEWYRSNPAAPHRIKHATMEGESRPSGLGKSFGAERLGMWKPRAVGAGAPIPVKLWQSLADPESRRAGDIAVGIDVTPQQEHAAISIYGLRADGLGHVQLVAYGPGTSWVYDKLVELDEQLAPIAFCLDVKGGAGALLQRITRSIAEGGLGITLPDDPERPESGDLIIPSMNEVAAGVGQFINACKAPGGGEVRHTGQGDLFSAVTNAKLRPLGDASAWGRRQSDIDISPLVSATLARWAYITRAPLIVSSDYDATTSIY